MKLKFSRAVFRLDDRLRLALVWGVTRMGAEEMGITQ